MLPKCVGGLIPLRLPPPPTSASSLPVRFTSWIQKILTNCSNAVWETLERDILSVRYVRNRSTRPLTDVEKTHTHTHNVTKLQIITARLTRYSSHEPVVYCVTATVRLANFHTARPSNMYENRNDIELTENKTNRLARLWACEFQRIPRISHRKILLRSKCIIEIFFPEFAHFGWWSTHKARISLNGSCC